MGRVAGAIGDGDVGEREQLLPAVPAGQAFEGVGAEDEYQRALRAEFGAQALQREHGVAFLGGAYFAVVDLQARVAAGRQLHHRQTVVGRTARLAAVRRLAGGDQAHPFQRQGFAGFFRQAQVAEVDGVEGATEQTQGAERVSGCVLRRHRDRCGHC